MLQVTGEKVAALAAALKVGDAVRINANVSIGSVSKQIIMHNSSMYRFLNGGNWNAVNDATPCRPPASEPIRAGTTVKLVCVDGRTSIDTGMNYWQLYMTMKKLGLLQCDPFRRRRLHDVVEMGERPRRDRQQALRLEGRAQPHELHACRDQK